MDAEVLSPSMSYLEKMARIKAMSDAEISNFFSLTRDQFEEAQSFFNDLDVNLLGFIKLVQLRGLCR